MKMDVVIEFVVEDIFKSAEFYKKYLGFEIEFTEYEPTSWMQLKTDTTNTTDTSSNPKTGDNILTYVVLLLTSMFGLSATLYLKKFVFIK